MRSINITVAGQTFQIRSDAEEEYVKELASEISERFTTIRRNGVRQGQQFKAMSMVAIALLDELTHLKSQHSDLRDQAKQFATLMISRIDEFLSSKAP